MKKLHVLFFLTIGLSLCSFAQHPFQNPDLPLKERVSDLVSRMTLEEKISQMMNGSPEIERLGVPAYNWWNEGLHGVARTPYPVTSFPQAIGMAATWDVESLEKMGDYTSTEGRAIFNDATKKGSVEIFQGLTYWTPNINILRDPRWGRGMETYGEDPYLMAKMGGAFVRGIQGNDSIYLKASACAKHYAVHSGPESSRHTYNAVVSKYDLWDTYLPAFRALIVEEQVSGVMCAYNAIEGQPCCGSDLLMNSILRNNWGFKGYVTSDCNGIGNFYLTHKTSPDAQSAAATAVLHGTDVECSTPGNVYVYKALMTAYKNGLITEDQIDISLKRLFTIRFRLGMFDPLEMVPYSDIDLSVLECDEHKEHALKLAQEAIVLLKNEKHTLPLAKNLKSIAIVGPNADDERVLLSNYYGMPSEITTLLEGIKAKVPASTEVIYEQGINLIDNKVFKESYNESLFSYEGKQGFSAEYYQNMDLEGSPVLTRHEEKIDHEWGDGQVISGDVLARNLGVRWKTTFTPDQSGEIAFQLSADDRCSFFINGKKVHDAGRALSTYTLDAEKGKNYDLVIEYQQRADNAYITFTTGIVEEVDAATIANRVKTADVIIFAGGISAALEGEQMGVHVEGFSGGDRTLLHLPKIQLEMLKELKATGKPVVLVLMTGSALAVNWEAANLPAIVNAWYGGQAGGTAIADVLFGDYNPAGRLPVTFYKGVEDLPDFEDYSMENRTYRYFKGEPLFPFGYGLSYTTFKYDNLDIPDSTLTDCQILVKATVKNTGKMDGDEVVQVYLSHKNTGMRVPIRALKSFSRIHLKAGESRVVEFVIGPEELALVDEEGMRIVNPGELEISVGGCQPEATALSAKKAIKGTIVLAGERVFLDDGN
jgi:beta-glucosidase